ncbi:hypothetical protein [Microcoleus sp. FACHB-68]|uniref:hypothetical protein n=1 Tax=Microcoleus sp. FACHB-68 TaxID=2692826 RepID=UPI0016837BEB|nr:hypothetical protein [Microcoleus sp. FACHB-68]MBD1937571.1 hypothetical protein [Microcoleus sp. FACHB-68]
MRHIFANVNRGIILRTLARLALIGSATFGLATVLNWGRYNGYWNGTHYRSQTTDFKILARQLPANLWAALLSGSQTEIGEAGSSNNGKLGILVTNCKLERKDCPAQQILYASPSYFALQKPLEVADLSSYPYALLRNPTPLLAGKDSAPKKDANIEAGSREQIGEIIGRVYYFRENPPSFFADYTSWLFQPWNLSGLHKYYSLTVGLLLASGIAGWAIIETILCRKRRQQKRVQDELNRVQRELQEKNQRMHLVSLIAPKLIAQKERILAEMKRCQIEQQQTIQELETEIADYENQLTQKEQQQQQGSSTLEQLQTELIEMRQSQNQAQAGIQEYEQALHKLQKQLVAWEAEKHKRLRSLKKLEEELQETQIKTLAFETQVEEKNHLIQSLSKKLEETEQETWFLEEQLAESESVKAQAIAREEYFWQEYQKDYEKLENDYKDLQTECEELKHQYEEACKTIGELEEQLHDCAEKIVETSSTIDLSHIHLGLVGGQPKIRQCVLSELSKNYGLREYSEIEHPNMTEKKVKDKLTSCNLIILINGSVSHSIYKHVRSLKSRGALQGEVLQLPLRCNATSSIVRVILAHCAPKH